MFYHVGEKSSVSVTLTALLWPGLKIQLDSHVEVYLCLCCTAPVLIQIMWTKKNLHGVKISHHHESSTLQRLSLSWDSSPGLYLAVILCCKSDPPVFFNLQTAALASWRGRAAAGVLPTWAAPTPTGRSLETQKSPMGRDETVFLSPTLTLKVSLHSIWNWLYYFTVTTSSLI